MARRKKKAKAQNGDGSFRIKPSGLIEYRFCYKDEYDRRQRKYSRDPQIQVPYGL